MQKFHTFTLKASKKLVLFFCLILFSTLPYIAQSQTPVSGAFTINSALPTSGNNFQTFTEAVFSLAYGVNGAVVFDVVPGSGPYIEQININYVPGVSAVNTITFNGNGETIQNTSTNPLSRAVIKLDGARYVTLRNLTIVPITTTASDSYGWGVGVLRDADHNAIRKCNIVLGTGSTVYSQNNIGIYVGSTDDFPNTNGISDCDHNIIDSNTIIGGYDGIDLNNYGGNYSIDFTSMDSNQVTNNNISGFRNSGIHLIWNKGTLVQGNDIRVALMQSASGINGDEKNTRLRINGNRIHNVTTDAAATSSNFKAIHFTSCEADEDNRNLISNNLIYDIRNTTEQKAISIDNCTYFDVVHNTVMFDGSSTAGGSVLAGIYLVGSTMNIRVQNNIVALLQTGAGTGYGIYVAATSLNLLCDYNNILLAGTNNFGRNTSTTYATLASWQAATGRDVHSASLDPIFTDAATGNFKPTNAAIDNMGTFAGVTRDVVFEIKNNNTPDVGAYEFLTPPCNTPVAGGASIVIPTIAVCGGGLRTLNLSGNTFGTGQTYQWQSSATLAGTYVDLSGSLVTPVFDVYPTTSLYYRAVVTCGAGVAISEPLLVAVNQPLAGSYTINSALPTAGSNYQSFAAALHGLKCGITGPVVFDVASGSGPYNEQVIFNAIEGASAVNTITINGNAAAVNYLSLNTQERAVIKLNGADYITINNLTVTALATGTGDYGFGIQLLNGATHNVISNCRVTVSMLSNSFNLAGIVVNSSATDALGSNASYCDFNKITGNTITGGYYGVVFYSNATERKMYYDTLSDNIIKDAYAYAVYMLGTAHAVVENNDISRPARPISGSTQLNGIGFSNVSTSLILSKNRIHATVGATPAATNATVGILFNNCDAPADSVNIVSNNVLYDFGGLGSQVGISNTGSDNILYYHNTISLENKVGTPTTTARAIYQTTSAANLQFKDNLISITRSGTGTNHGLYLNATGTTFAASNNNYYIAGSGTNRIGFRNAVNYSTVATWQAATSNDANSLSLNPSYSDLPNGILFPTNPLLDNKGVFADILTDVLNVPRSNSTPDIGAYEFTGVVPVKLLSLSAAKKGTDINVIWVTSSEINSSHFVVERSANGADFTAAGSVQAKGNSATEQRYSFTDLDAAYLATAKVLYYRLKMVDVDGRIEYSATVLLRFDNSNDVKVAVTPNPFFSALNANVSTTIAGQVTIQVTDVAGRTISTQTQMVPAGNSIIGINNAARLQKGTYLVRITLNGKRYVQKLIK